MARSETRNRKIVIKTNNMSNLNLVQLIGRVGKPIEMKQVGNSSVANFSLGISEKYTNKDNEKVESTEWVSCQVWGKQAEVIEKYVGKGDLLYVSGKLKTRSWEKDGVKHYATEVLVNDFKFFPKTREANQTSDDAPEYQSTGLKQRILDNNAKNNPIDDDDTGLPF